MAAGLGSGVFVLVVEVREEEGVWVGALASPAAGRWVQVLVRSPEPRFPIRHARSVVEVAGLGIRTVVVVWMLGGPRACSMILRWYAVGC